MAPIETHFARMKEQEVGRTLQMGVFGMARLPWAGRFSVVAGQCQVDPLLSINQPRFFSFSERELVFHLPGVCTWHTLFVHAIPKWWISSKSSSLGTSMEFRSGRCCIMLCHQPKHRTAKLSSMGWSCCVSMISWELFQGILPGGHQIAGQIHGTSRSLPSISSYYPT